MVTSPVGVTLRNGWTPFPPIPRLAPVLRLLTSYTYQEGMRDVVTHILRVSEDIREGSPADLKVAGESRWETVLGFCGDDGRGWGAGAGWGLHGLNFQLAPKEEASSLSDELAQMWGRMESDSLLHSVCSKYCTGHTDAKFICLKFKFNWVSCVFIVAVKSGNLIYRAEKGKSLAASWDCSATTPTLSHLLPDFLFFETNEPLFSLSPC